MRILSIAGQNIASLAEPFLIDLAEEPLRSAGLFAITGETGAGKSSILDAMCLALYGDAPRLSSGSSQDEIPDAAGEAIKARDPRAILRRGAAQGWAKVRFLGIDGQAYEAAWSARRSRDKVDGRLQGVARQIARLSDGQVLASQLTAVTEQVQTLTGLSYDEFRRTVLLAQGDFDAFLRADTNDRAALLEKVTGTGLYRAISARVFDRTTAAQQALTTLTLQLDAHHLLSDEATASLQTNRQTLLAEIDTAKTSRLTLDADLARHTRHAQAAARLSEALDALAQAQSTRDTAEPSRARLATIDRAEPLRLPYESARSAEAAQIKAAAALTAADMALAQTSAKAQTQNHLAAAATDALDATEAAYKRFGPIWSEATRQDSQITTATAEAQAAAEAARAATTSAQTLDAKAKALLLTSQNLQSERTEAAARLDAIAPLSPLAERWEQIARDLTDHAGAAQTRATALAQSDALTKATQQTALSQAQLESADAIDREARLTVAQRIAALTIRIAALDATHPQDQLTRLTDLATTLSTLDRAAQDHAAALSRQSDASLLLATETEARSAALLAKAEAETALARAEAAIAALTAPAERANLAASEAARQLRLRLVSGEACPVCGATEHQTHADDALTALATSLRADLAGAKAAAQTAGASLTQAKGQAAAAEARGTQARQTLTAEAARAQAALTLWAEGLQTARAFSHCPALPDLPTDAETLHQARLDTETARQSATAALQSLSTLRTGKDTADRQHAALSTAIDSRALQRQTLTGTEAEQAQQAALARQTAEVADQRCTDLAAQLAPHLAAAGEPLSALTDAPTALRTRLHAKVQAFTAALQAEEALERRLTDLRPLLATTQAQAIDAARLAENARQSETARREALHALTLSRAELLDGEPTDTHRTRHNDARLAAQTAKAEADAAMSLAFSAESRIKGTRDSAAFSLSQAATAVEEAHDRLLLALSATDIPPESLPALFALPRSEVETLRQSLRALEDAVTAAQSAHDARKADLTAAEAAGLPEATAADLTAALAALEAAQAGRQEEIGAINTQLATDAATRASLTGLQTRIEAAKATHDIWSAVNDAIGSRTGDAFARIAQSITLDQLVDHANHHLADLKPRYRLRRAAGLALQVEDLDMGAEPRATRSLSGGERFLVSLALALALSRMGDKGGLAATLFIDEGFGSLDAESLDVAIDALETLQSQGRMIGVISHVEAMKDRIPVQIRVRRQGGGKSVVSVEGPK